MITSIILISLLVALNGFFVSVEFAVIAVRRERIDILAEEGNPSARVVKGWIENPATRDRLIAASQLGITMVSLALGAVSMRTFDLLLEPLFQDLVLLDTWQAISPILVALPLLLTLVVVTSFHVVLGEQIPKVVTLHKPETFALLVARPMYLFSILFNWFVGMLDWITRQILSLVGLRMVGEHSIVNTVEEIKKILTESEEGGVIQSPEREMLDAIFNLNELLVRQVMIPRTEVVAVAADTSLEEIIDLATQTTFTKIPIYEDSLDQVLGIVHVKDLLRARQSTDCDQCMARDLAREPIFVPETASINILLQQFRDNRQHIAIVLDEYGGTAGIVTLEDLLEEIVGEVSDPFDALLPEIQLLPDGTALIDGLTLIEDVNHHLRLHLEDPDYDTIAGYALGILGRIPEVGDVVERQGVRLQVESMDGMRIARLRLERLPLSGDADLGTA